MRRSVFATMLAPLALVSLGPACGGEDPGDGSFGGGSSGSSPTTATSTGQSTSGGSGSSTSDASSSVSSGSGGGTATCTDLGDPCTTCELAECAEVYCDCYDNVECGALSACVANCGGTADCYQGCATEHPEGISGGALLTHCAGTVCTDACPGYVPLAPCQECLYTRCQGAMNTCVANPECTLLLYCLDACVDPDCTNDCYFEYPDGTGDAGPVGTCLQDECPVECG
jgi:hypothetical protein